MVIKYRTHNASFIMATKYYDHFEFWQWRWQATINTRKGFTMYLFKHDSYYNSGVTWIKFKKKQKQKRKKGFSQNSFFWFLIFMVNVLLSSQLKVTDRRSAQCGTTRKHDLIWSLVVCCHCCFWSLHNSNISGNTHTHNTWLKNVNLLQLPTVVSYDRRTLLRHCSTNLHSSRQSGISSCWTTVVEQLSIQPTTVRPYPSSVPLGVKDVFVWLTGTPAASDFCF